MENLAGKQFGRYKLISLIGEGGMAAVYKAYQPGVERHVAIKVLPQELARKEEFLGRFRHEARVLAQLQHPHILPVFDYGETAGYPYIVMPLMQNGTLATLLQGQPLEEGKITRIISQVGGARDYAHERGLIHRDIKPSNILLDESKNCLLSDFGIARILEATARFTVTGGVLGTPTYMSPEQGRGDEIDGRSDVYSLGVVLYEMVTGRVPFQADTPLAVVYKHINEPLPHPRDFQPEISANFEQAILKSLAKSPENRFSSAAEMIQTLQGEPTKFVNFSTFTDTIIAAPESSPKGQRKRFPLLYLVTGLILALLLVACSLAAIINRILSPGTGVTPTAVAAVVDEEPAPMVSPTVLVETATLASTNTAIPLPTEPLATETSPPPRSSETPLPELLPTVVPPPTTTLLPPTLSPTPSCPVVTGLFANAWSQVQDRIGCATGAEVSGLIVEENFERGKMIWREPIDVAQALVFFNDRTWKIFQHAPFVEGSPEFPCADANTPAQSPPTPKRGFGTMWCDIPEIRNGLGNATDEEKGFNGFMQDYDRGFMLRTDNNTTYIFFEDGVWESR